MRVRREALAKEGAEHQEVTTLFVSVDEIDSAFTNIVLERPVQEGLTDESKNREGLKRKGRLIDPQKNKSNKKPDSEKEHE